MNTGTNTDQELQHVARGSQKLWMIAFIIPLILTVVFNVIFFPLLNSGDDAFIMYTLAGGFGEDPSHYLQYNHGWHYWLGSMVVYLFRVYDGVNWYAIFLSSIHILSLAGILYILLKRNKQSVALILFGIFYLFMESRFLMSLSFSNTAFVAGISACFILYHQVERERFVTGLTIAGILLMLLAGLLRWHVILFILALFLPFAVARFPVKKALVFLAGGAAVAILVFGVFKLHEDHYIRQNPQWKKQEEFRQALIFSYNRPIKKIEDITVFRSDVEKEKFFSGLLYDTVQFSTARVNEISRGITRQRGLGREDMRGFYWLFMELRIYLLLFGFSFLFLWLNGKARVIWRWLIPLGIYLAIQVYLYIFLKSTYMIHIGLIMYLWLTLCLLYTHTNLKTGRTVNQLFSAVLIILCLWMGWRLIKEDRSNRDQYRNLQCMMEEISKHRANLFMVYYDIFPLSRFYIWEHPKRYLLPNLLYKDRIISFTYRHTLERFGIKDLDSAVKYDKRIFFMWRLAIDSGYKISLPLPEFECMDIRKLE